MQWIQLGDLYLNVDRIVFIRRQGETLLVTFDGAGDLKLEAHEAEGLLNWLEGEARDLIDPPWHETT